MVTKRQLIRTIRDVHAELLAQADDPSRPELNDVQRKIMTDTANILWDDAHSSRPELAADLGCSPETAREIIACCQDDYSGCDSRETEDAGMALIWLCIFGAASLLIAVCIYFLR